MSSRITTAGVLIAATIAGLGTTLWTVATTEPAKLPVLDAMSAATASVKEFPNRITSWNSVAVQLIRRGEPSAQVAAWLGARDPAWVAEQGAGAMLWYSVSHQLALTTERFNPDFSRPESVAARSKAIDLLVDLSHKHPERMRYWHWNSLAWAWIRSGQRRFAQGALERTEQAIFSSAGDESDDPTPGEFVLGLNRLVSCWGDTGMADRAKQIALLHRIEGMIDQRGEATTGNFTYVWLAQHFFNLNEREEGFETLSHARSVYLAADPSVDLRENWRRLAGAYAARGHRDEALEAVESFAAQLDHLGQGVEPLSWNRAGWSFELLDASDRAQDCWGRWLAIQQKNIQSGATDSGSFYNLACGFALTGDPDGALDALDRAVAAGYSNVTHLENDRDLTSLRDEDRFQDLLESLRAKIADRAKRAQTPTRGILQRR